MKVRSGFVSNSSSSSFVIKKSDLDDPQIRLIKDHIVVGKALDRQIDFYEDDFEDEFKPEPFLYSDDWKYDEWKIYEDDDTVGGSVILDNFDMERFLRFIGVDSKRVDWGE